jgi:hypothetical protein
VPITVVEVSSSTFSAREPSTLGELLMAGKKVPADATALLMQDHAEVEAMFRQYEMDGDKGERRPLRPRSALPSQCMRRSKRKSSIRPSGRPWRTTGL